MKLKSAVTIAIAAFIASCAKPPEKIAALQVSNAEYLPLSCEELKAKRAYVAMTLKNVSKQQTDTSTGDAVGVILLGVPTSSMMGGDLEASVAFEKGKLAAIEKTMQDKGCPMEDLTATSKT